jgi:hypothetical protein
MSDLQFGLNPTFEESGAPAARSQEMTIRFALGVHRFLDAEGMLGRAAGRGMAQRRRASQYYRRKPVTVSSERRDTVKWLHEPSPIFSKSQTADRYSLHAPHTLARGVPVSPGVVAVLDARRRGMFQNQVAPKKVKGLKRKSHDFRFNPL